MEIVPSSFSLDNSVETVTNLNKNVKEENTKPTFADHAKAKHKVSEPEAHDNKEVNDPNEAKELSNWIDADLSFIQKASDTFEKYKDEIQDAKNQFQNGIDERNLDKLRNLKKIVAKLKERIFSWKTSELDDADAHRNTGKDGSANVKRGNANTSINGIPKLHMNRTFTESFAIKDFEVRFNDLSIELKLCVLCFSVFPENVTIKKRLMIYWWIGEGFVRETPGKTSEQLANDFFKELIVKGFIEPVYERCNLVADSCKMHPFFRSALIMQAEMAAFFDFDEGNVTESFSRSLRACLVGKGLANIQDLENLHLMFNVNEPILEFKLEWFLKMKNINVLYLGRWQTSATQHIEVEDTKFLDGLMNMNYLKFFSLHGVSKITKLPKSISRLKNLIILDLRACHNFEEIPNDIGLLKSLTHLDISECYLLDHMHKGLALISQLQVLKGFVITKSKSKNSCTLVDLVKLTKLRKLSIYTGVDDFPTKTDLDAFRIFKVLHKLTIAWGRGSLPDNTDKSAKKMKDATKSTAPEPVTPDLLSKLEKLELRCFPGTITHSWLMPSNLTNLQKLYIRGGKFSNLGQVELDGKWEPKKDQWIVKSSVI
ncbi:hypothetical protein F0562_014187 [Nyssa sinensis]|uniref:Uncharacterized protein n=1 Tax=Nyssa sinensis TaxID=561372 RepID=A0A5J4ZM17_9ASTE|nr:hypothetical protein F0562_014187 [Nyssa sinensis]